MKDVLSEKIAFMIKTKFRENQGKAELVFFRKE